MSAVSEFSIADADIVSASLLLSNSTTFTDMLLWSADIPADIAAGVSVLAPTSVTVRAAIEMNLDSADLLSDVVSQHESNVDSGVYSAQVAAAVAGASVLFDGDVMVIGGGGGAATGQSGSQAISCTAAGLACFPGVPW